LLRSKKPFYSACDDTATATATAPNYIIIAAIYFI
jgi:hypothetical protein